MKIVDMCMQIPVYPDAVSRCGLSITGLPAEAPVCEDDGGYISFVSEESKTRFINAGCKFNWREQYD